MRDKKELVKSYKTILPYLCQVSQDKFFLVRVLKKLDSKTKEQELLNFLKESSKVTVEDVYEKMNELTGGSFSVSNRPVQIAKKVYMEDSSDDNLCYLIRVLIGEGVFTIENWNLTEEEEKRFAGAVIGDTIVVETNSIPVLICDECSGDIMISIYSTENEISAQNKARYAVRMRSFNRIVEWFRKLSESMDRNIRIILDGDGMKSVILPKDFPRIYNKEVLNETKELEQIHDKVMRHEETVCPYCGKGRIVCPQGKIEKPHFFECTNKCGWHMNIDYADCIVE